MENNTECAICCLKFNHERKKPRICPCGHTICEECLRQILGRDNPQCPYCNEQLEDTDITRYTVVYQLVPENTPSILKKDP